MNEARRHAGGFSRFIALGISDARERWARLTAHEPPDDRAIVAVIEASAVAGALVRAVEAISAAGRKSTLVNATFASRRAWMRLSIVDRTRLTGIVLVAAGAAHLVLVVWQGPMPGWLWLVAPALAIGFGALMALAPARGLGPEARR